MWSHFSHVWLFATVWTIACQTPLSKEFSRQAYLSWLPCPPPGDLHEAVIEPISPESPALAGGFFTTSTTGDAPLGRYSWSNHWLCDWLYFHPVTSPLPGGQAGSKSNSIISYSIFLVTSPTLKLFRDPSYELTSLAQTQEWSKGLVNNKDSLLLRKF